VLYGDFIGFNAMLKRVQIPYSSMDEILRDKVRHNEFRESAPRIAKLVSESVDEIGEVLPPDIHGLINQNFLREDFVISRAWRWVSKERMGGILSTVQNRILDFTLELESRADESGDPLKQLRAMPQKVKQEFHNHIMGNVGNLSQGGDHVAQNATIHQGDLEAVVRKMRDFGLSMSEADEFAELLSAEKPNADGSFSQRLKNAIAKASAMAGNGMIEVSKSVLSGAIATVCKQYLGVPE
jgi:hypothetical protein